MNSDMMIVQGTSDYIMPITHNFTGQINATTNLGKNPAMIGFVYMAEYFEILSKRALLKLLRRLRFALNETCMESRAVDKFARIHSFFDAFTSKCRNGYQMSEFVSVDEMRPAVRGRCSF